MRSMKSMQAIKLITFLSVVFLQFELFASMANQPVRANPAIGKTETQHVQAKLISDVRSVQPGKSFKLGIELTMEPGWHTYYKEPGDSGMPTKIEWMLPPGFKAGELLWEHPQRFDEGRLVTYGYNGKTLIATNIATPQKIGTGTVSIKARVKWLACKEICVPGGTEISSEIPVGGISVPIPQIVKEKFARVGFAGSIKDIERSTDRENRSTSSESKTILDEKLNIQGSPQAPPSLAMYFFFALIGGLILNIMPCVLPVIAIKVLSFFEQADDEPDRIRLLGLTFAAGIIASFLALALTVIAIQKAGQTIGWGFQFQHPLFLVVMSTIVLLLSLSLFSFFYVSVPTGQIDQLANKEGYLGTFFKGVLATILSTPCTAPFLGTALGFAFAQPWWIIVGIFFTIGLGMSLPYLLLTAKPEWMRYMPKPGAWMEKFKESMGFVLLATVVWLLGILGSQVGVDGMLWTGFFLVAVAFAAWMVSRFTDLTSTTSRKWVVNTCALLIIAVTFYICVIKQGKLGLSVARLTNRHATPNVTQSKPDMLWQPFSLQLLDKYLHEGYTVLVDFSAEWCLTCKVNEQTVLMSEPVINKLKALNVVALEADWTTQDPTITRLLNKFNRSGVPLYVIFPAGKPTEPIVLPEVITQSLVLKKLDEAGPSKVAEATPKKTAIGEDKH